MVPQLCGDDGHRRAADPPVAWRDSAARAAQAARARHAAPRSLQAARYAHAPAVRRDRTADSRSRARRRARRSRGRRRSPRGGAVELLGLIENRRTSRAASCRVTNLQRGRSPQALRRRPRSAARCRGLQVPVHDAVRVQRRDALGDATSAGNHSRTGSTSQPRKVARGDVRTRRMAGRRRARRAPDCTVGWRTCCCNRAARRKRARSLRRGTAAP